MKKLPLSNWINEFMNYLLSVAGNSLNSFSHNVSSIINTIDQAILFLPWYIVTIFIVILSYKAGKWRLSLGSLLGFLLIENLGLWNHMISTLVLVIIPSVLAIFIGLPLGILSARNKWFNRIIVPLLDLMQTMPSFVYLVPVLMFFNIGVLPAIIATLIFAMPPVIRLTSIGIKQVPSDLVEACRSFGSTNHQLLWKVQLPLAITSIKAGINQTIMLSLSMVVIASMIGAGGLGSDVMSALQTINVGQGFEAGISIVIIAVILDRISQHIGKSSNKNKRTTLLSIILIFILIVGTGIGFVQKSKTTLSSIHQNKVTIGYVNWDEDVATSYLWKYLLTQKGYQVTLKELDLGPLYTGLSMGGLDLYFDAWMPEHQPFLDKYKDSIQNLGKWYQGSTTEGFVVPSYLKSLNSIEDLKNYSKNLNNQIIGIDPGAVETQLSQKAIKEYAIPEHLTTSSSTAMLSALDRAYSNKQPIVVTLWSPHWSFSKYKLKYLSDPKGIFGKPGTIQTEANTSWVKDNQDAVRWIQNFKLTPEQLGNLELDIQQASSPELGVKEWTQHNQELIKKWLD